MPENDYNILRPLYRLAKSHFEGQKYELAEVDWILINANRTSGSRYELCGYSDLQATIRTPRQGQPLV